MIYDIAIIGGGVAGCSVAYHAHRQGYSAIIIEAGQGLASAASGNPVGLIKPMLDINDSKFFQFHKNAFEYFLQLWPQLNIPAMFQGIAQLPIDEADVLRIQRRATAAHNPTGWAEWQSATLLSKYLGTACHSDGIWFPNALAIDPVRYCHALARDMPVLSQAQVTAWERINDNWVVIIAQRARIQANANLDPQADGLRMTSEIIKAKNVIVCAGVEALGLPALTHLPIRPRRGQLTYLAENSSLQLNRPVTFGHYLAPAINGQTIIGATYTHCAWNADITLSEDEHQRNLNAYTELQKLLPNLPSTVTLTGGRAAIRATTPQQLPIYGPILNQPNAYYLTGLGSRGLMTAPYVANELFKSIGSAALAR